MALLPGIAFAETVAVATADDAVDAAGKLGWPVVAKVDGGSTAHKSELGLVRVGLATQAELRAAFAELSAKRETLGDGTVVIQPQLEGVEIALGVHRDPTFGPVVMIGLGGIFIEQLNDVAFGLPPLSPAQAEQMLRRLRGWPLLAGARGRPPSTSATWSTPSCSSATSQRLSAGASPRSTSTRSSRGPSPAAARPPTPWWC